MKRHLSVQQTLSWFRYFLEIIAIPAFGVLVIHLSGHGLFVLLETAHTHTEHQVETFSFTSLFSQENLAGALLLIFFVWIWSTKHLKKVVPCRHESCTHKSAWPHIFASLALVLHFFPEAGIRAELFQRFSENSTFSVIGMIGFISHFFIDIIVSIFIVSFWKNKWISVLHFLIIAGIWIVAFLVQENIFEIFPEKTEGILFLFSGFLLSIFLHKPHKPVIKK